MPYRLTDEYRPVRIVPEPDRTLERWLADTDEAWQQGLLWGLGAGLVAGLLVGWGFLP